jgi:hypothetical protein
MKVCQFESHMLIANWCASWKIATGAQNLVLQAQQFRKLGVRACFQAEQAYVIIDLMMTCSQ